VTVRKVAVLVVVAAGSIAGVGMRAQNAAPLEVRVEVGRPGATIPSTMYGLFFEDINFAADGGLNAERVKNRSFEFPDPLMGWRRAMIDGSRGHFGVATDRPASPANPHYLRLQSDAGTFGVSNDGFRGIGIEKDKRYRVAVLARRQATSPGGLRVDFENTQGKPLGGTTLAGLTEQWKAYGGEIVATVTDAHAHLRVLTDGPGTVDVDMVSLMPADTWRGRQPGLRADLVQLLADMHPGFLRFPGGCIVEGRFLDGRYEWKNTIGDPSERRLIINRWNDEFPGRAAPDYYQSFGIGFYEYFQLAEDIGAAPLPILNCGMACQFNSGELAPLSDLDTYIRDALDLVEFANGPVTSEWGKKRAAFGHPAPFNLKMLGVGNEQWGPQYIERYAKFREVFTKQYPEIDLVASADPFWKREEAAVQMAKLRELNPAYIDEHFYSPPDWFLKNVGRYDSYPRTGPHVFVGEFAAHLAPRGPENMRPSTLQAALAEAAFMTGLERNADIVGMASYAPLFAHVEAWQWTPNLIWFDNLRSYGTPSYYVQQLFGRYRGDTLLPVSIDGSKDNGAQGVFVTSSLQTTPKTVIVKLVNPGGEPKSVRLALDDVNEMASVETTVLAGAGDAMNSLDDPKHVVPADGARRTLAGPWTLPPNSLTIARVAMP
jgi:alpha-L-arabinofuranosidase